VSLTGLLLTSKALGGLALASSLWSSTKQTWEIRVTTYSTFLALVVQLELVIASLYVDNFGLDMVRVTVCLSVSLVASISLCIVWVPRTAIILNEKLEASIADDPTSGSDARIQSPHSSHKRASRRPNDPKAEVEVVTPLEALFTNMPSRASASGLPRMSTKANSLRNNPPKHGDEADRSSGSHSVGRTADKL
jgi:hypothetical protein